YFGIPRPGRGAAQYGKAPLGAVGAYAVFAPPQGGAPLPHRAALVYVSRRPHRVSAALSLPLQRLFAAQPQKDSAGHGQLQLHRQPGAVHPAKHGRQKQRGRQPDLQVFAPQYHRAANGEATLATRLASCWRGTGRLRNRKATLEVK
nr:hypothetical protein [Tanacetum cinerariifolium]